MGSCRINRQQQLAALQSLSLLQKIGTLRDCSAPKLQRNQPESAHFNRCLKSLTHI